MTQSPDNPKAVFKWDGTVNIPTLIAFCTVALAVVAWAHNMSVTATTSTNSIVKIEATMDKVVDKLGALERQNVINEEIRKQVQDHESRLRAGGL